MSIESQPDPVLPNYNPSAWAPSFSTSVLDANYVKFPTAQNVPITFPSNVTINGTVTTTTINSLGTNTLSINTGNTTTVGKLVTPPDTYTATNFPFNVCAPSEYGARFYPENGLGNKGNIVLGGCFPLSDTRPRRIADIYAGFTGFDWATSYMSLAVGSGGVSNEGNLPTVEQMRISQSTITINKPITPAYTYPIGAGKIGQLVAGTFLPSGAGLTFITGTSKTYSSVSLTAGIWSISSYSIIATSVATVITQAESYYSTGTANYGTIQIQNQQNTSTTSSISLPVNAIIYLTATTTISQIVTVQFSGTAPTASSFEFRLQAVRIA